ncbi:hypothetical protein TNCV_4301391 [Trichonephila clavipes]|uniref:Uncharacterized protein n=1 Tax=Trichonephila clavipes TaxID=2585209 RepID=A0A8X6RU83_TRICX|nr:hypothetical protein TNCV_4301391 [Trichonephila clavipes]
MLLDEVKALRKEVADLRRSRSQFRHNNNVRRKRSNSRSIAAKPRRLAPDRLKIAKAEFQHMIKLNHIRPSKSAYASPLHMTLHSKAADILEPLVKFREGHPKETSSFNANNPSEQLQWNDAATLSFKASKKQSLKQRF